MANEKDSRPDFTTSEKEGLFTQVRRQSQERRAVADRRSSARRAAETQEIARQLAARAEARKPALGVPEPPAEAPTEAIKDDPA